jgi:hypothetical protein
MQHQPLVMLLAYKFGNRHACDPFKGVITARAANIAVQP